MKRLFPLLAVVLLFSACKPDPAAGEAGDQAQVGTTAPVTSGEGSYATPVTPAIDDPVANTLMKTFWVAEHWVDHSIGGNDFSKKGFWWRFLSDGTFGLGIWEEQLASGSWTLTQTQEKLLLHIDASVDQYDMEFEIQGIANNDEYMSWVGTDLYGMNQIAIKAISLLSMPTKQQFGVE